MMTLPRLLVALLVVALATPVAMAHGVDDPTRRFLESVTGPAIVPFLYIGAKHMVTGYDHLLFLVGVIFFLYSTKDAEHAKDAELFRKALDKLKARFGEKPYLKDFFERQEERLKEIERPQDGAGEKKDGEGAKWSRRDALVGRSYGDTAGCESGRVAARWTGGSMSEHARWRVLSLVLPLTLVLVTGCGDDATPSPGGAREPAPAWSKTFVRGSEAGLARARGSGRGAMLVVSASW